MITISNEFLKIDISEMGAELQSIYSIKNRIEYLWQGDPKHWGRRSPVLFPVIGGLVNGQYIHKGQHYSLSKHGFARDSQFELISSGDEYATFILRDSADTIREYPFSFELKITYRLVENTVITEYEVNNLGDELMPFSIGGHPAFNCPIEPLDVRSSYDLVFNSPETADTLKINLSSGLLSGKTERILSNESTLNIKDDLFEEDALIFHNLASKSVSLVSGGHTHWSFDLGEFPYLGIWSANHKSPFVCIEPWFGVCDHDDHNQVLLDKTGIVKIDSGQSHHSKYSVTMHNN